MLLEDKDTICEKITPIDEKIFFSFYLLIELKNILINLRYWLLHKERQYARLCLKEYLGSELRSSLNLEDMTIIYWLIFEEKI